MSTLSFDSLLPHSLKRRPAYEPKSKHSPSPLDSLNSGSALIHPPSPSPRGPYRIAPIMPTGMNFNAGTMGKLGTASEFIADTSTTNVHREDAYLRQNNEIAFLLLFNAGSLSSKE